jgi:hypothetical protein
MPEPKMSTQISEVPFEVLGVKGKAGQLSIENKPRIHLTGRINLSNYSKREMMMCS